MLRIDRVKLLILEFRDRFNRIGFQQLGPKFFEQNIGSIHVRTIHPPINRKDVTDYVVTAIHNLREGLDIAIRSLLDLIVLNCQLQTRN